MVASSVTDPQIADLTNGKGNWSYLPYYVCVKETNINLEEKTYYFLQLFLFSRGSFLHAFAEGCSHAL
jgi:hypothetical protein